ncbi:MAG TPA: heparan-alpha-glucosaminide N-acetyltransferase domain-containing protein [Terracidiphilus sp.]|nr:heparan-alpha-glucosaminide N-acetyltransferase domain-containing protein [Terracidiphilus sp.]
MTGPALASRPTRLLSLDVLRGLTIAFMIMVNNTGGEGAWTEMRHADWNGFTATDLVFPTFLFVVGITTVLSIQARLKRGDPRAKLAGHALLRAAILFLLGILVNGFPHYRLEHLRIYGVLQRIAVCYLIVSLLYIWDRRVWTKVALLFVVLAGYWILVRWVPVPGAGVPGRDVPFLDKDQNVVAWLDRQLMPGHLYEDPPAHDLRDPEGLLSDIPAIGTTLIGLLAGLWLCSGREIKTMAAGLASGAAACLAAGYFWSFWFPLNKKMWTSSYALVAAGWSLLLLALAYWAVEQRRWGRSSRSKWLLWPWLVFGSNAIVAYIIGDLLEGAIGLLPFTANGHRYDAFSYIYDHIFAHIGNPGSRALAYSLFYATICFLPVWALYRRKIFVKV